MSLKRSGVVNEWRYGRVLALDSPTPLARAHRCLHAILRIRIAATGCPYSLPLPPLFCTDTDRLELSRSAAVRELRQFQLPELEPRAFNSLRLVSVSRAAFASPHDFLWKLSRVFRTRIIYIIYRFRWGFFRWSSWGPRGFYLCSSISDLRQWNCRSMSHSRILLFILFILCGKF